MLFLLYISFHSHLLDAVLAKVKSYFRNQLDVVQVWEEFVARAPAGDCVQEYCRAHPLDIPFKVLVVAIVHTYIVFQLTVFNAGYFVWRRCGRLCR